MTNPYPSGPYSKTYGDPAHEVDALIPLSFLPKPTTPAAPAVVTEDAAGSVGTLSLAALRGSTALENLALGPTKAIIPNFYDQTTATVVSGTVYLLGFTAPIDMPINNLAGACRGTAAAGITTQKMGLYSVDVNGDATLMAASANLNLNVNTFSWGAIAPIATQQVVAGMRYAIAYFGICSTMPVMYGKSADLTSVGISGALITAGITRLVPWENRSLAGQVDLPSSIPFATMQGAIVPSCMAF